MPKFYPEGSAAPEVLPPFLVITPSGAWACSNSSEAIDLRDTLQAAHGARTVIKIVQAR